MAQENPSSRVKASSVGGKENCKRRIYLPTSFDDILAGISI